MAINRLNGEMLEANLLRQGVNIAFETDLLYVDVINGRIGIKTASPTTDFELAGVALINGQLTVDDLLLNNATLTATTGDLVLDSTSGQISVNNHRITNCLDPVAALDVVNLQTLNAAIGVIAAYQIIADNSRITVVDDGISAGFFEFVVDNVELANLSATAFQVGVDLQVSGDVQAATGNIASLNISGNTLSSDTATLGLLATNINLNGATTITGVNANRIPYANAASDFSSNANFTYNEGTNTLTANGVAIFDSLTLDGTGITSATSLELTTTANNELTISTGSGEINMTSSSALNLPSGTTAERPGAPNTGAFRWNTNNGQPEFYDGANWYTVPRDFNITSQQIIPNGVDTNFTLNKAATTDGVLVTINGVVQDPQGGAVYSVTGTTISFTDVLTASDVVSIRFLEF